MSQLSEFITFWQNSLGDWIRREIIDDDPWDERILDSLSSDSASSDSLSSKDRQNIPAIESIPKTDIVQSSISMIQQ